MDEEHECLLAVDRDHRNALAMKRLEPSVSVDYDFFEPKRYVVPNLLEHATRALAQMSADARVHDDLGLIVTVAYVAARHR